MFVFNNQQLQTPLAETKYSHEGQRWPDSEISSFLTSYFINKSIIYLASPEVPLITDMRKYKKKKRRTFALKGKKKKKKKRLSKFSIGLFIGVVLRNGLLFYGIY